MDPAALAKRREERAREQEALRLAKKQRRHAHRLRQDYPWASLLEATFGVSGLTCPKCGATLVLRAVVLDPASAAHILSSLGRSARAGPTGPLIP